MQSTAIYDRAFYGSATSSYLGRGLSIGDLSNDGQDDVIGGAYYANSNGSAYVFFGDQF